MEARKKNYRVPCLWRINTRTDTRAMRLKGNKNILVYFFLLKLILKLYFSVFYILVNLRLNKIFKKYLNTLCTSFFNHLRNGIYFYHSFLASEDLTILLTMWRRVSLVHRLSSMLARNWRELLPESGSI